MDWCEWFGFSFDPFFDKPLESDLEMKELLVVQKNVEEQMSPLIRQMSRIPFLCLVAGERGVGKSTTMYHSLISVKRSGYLPVYVGLDHIQLEFSTRPIYEITQSLMYELGVGLVTSIHNLKHTFFARNKNLLLSLSRYLFLKFEEFEGFFPSGKPYRVDLFELKRYILTILNLLKRAEIPTLIAIDNLDKVSKFEILKNFFKAPFAQTFFDTLRKGGASILIAMSPSFLQIKRRDRYLGYLAREIHVDPLSPPQTVELLTKRINYSNDPSPINPFEDRAMIHIGVKKKGITRDILNEARNLCLKSYEQRLSLISEKFVRKGLVSFNESRTFYELLDRSEELKEAALKLCELAVYTDLDLKQAISAINNIAEGKKIKVNTELLKTLIDTAIIEPSVRDEYLLSIPLSSLLKAVQESGWDISRFLNWIFERDTIHVLRGGIPGINAKSAIDRFGPIPNTSRTTISIIVGDIQQKMQTRLLHQDAISKLNDAKQILSDIGTLSWDNIDNLTVFKKIYWSLEAFLIAFSRLYISCATSKTIKIKSFKSFDLIENSVHHFQEEYQVSFKSFYRYLALRDFMKGLARGGFFPSYSHIKAAFEDFEEVVKEFTNIWQGISNTFATLRLVDENYESTLKEVSELAQLMGFSIERPEYRRFKIDGERYHRMGFSKFPIDEALIEVVREKRIRNRLGQVKSYFFLSSINPDSKRKAEIKEVLAFIAKCNDLIGIINNDNADAPRGWPKYFLLYASHYGFEPGIRAALKSTALPSGSQIRTVDYLRLKSLIRQLKPAKKMPTEKVSKENIDELRKQDLEQLLRIRLNTRRIIREKFVKLRNILLADMKDFTQRTARDAVESAEAVQKMSDILMNNVEKYGGVGANTEGDSFIATFSKPDQALLAALESIEELQDYNQNVAKERQIEVRIGICVGEVILKSGRPFIGNAVNIAARIMKEAEANQVVTTKDVYEKVSFFRNFKFESLGAKKLKGIDEPIEVYEAQLRERPK